MLIARIYEVFPLVCPQCGGDLKIVAFLTEADSIQRILLHIGEPATPPRIAPARGPPDWPEADFDQSDLNESDEAEPVPEFDKSAGQPIWLAESCPVRASNMDVARQSLALRHILKHVH